MEDVDRKRIIRSIPHDKYLKRLYDRHMRIEEKLSVFTGRTFLTSSEQIEASRLKKEKLRGVDRMMSIIRANNSEMHVS